MWEKIKIATYVFGAYVVFYFSLMGFVLILDVWLRV